MNEMLSSIIFFSILLIISYSKELIREDLTAFDYHRKIGIPEATRIKKLEDDMMNRNSQRIVGGTYVSISEVPYQVGLLIEISDPDTEGSTSLCGGSLIANNFVVTAAHCTFDGILTGQTFTVILGSNYVFYGGTRINSNDVVVHPGWNVYTLANDIALIRFAPVTFTNVIQPIDLPIGTEAIENFVGKTSIVSGFGNTQDDTGVTKDQRLSWIRVPIITNEECRSFYGPFLSETHICTSGKSGMSPCLGDSGGPLAVTWNGRKILVGLVSFGSDAGCSDELPAAYARITAYLAWIHSTSETYFCK